MSAADTLLDILKYLLPGLLMLAIAYIILKKFFDNEERKRFFELRAANQKIALPIRLQAYERLVLLLERISVNNLLLRVKKSGMSAMDFQTALMGEIRAEFEHNLSQQVYVSPEAWEMTVSAKESIVKMINIAYSQLQSNANALDLSKAVFELAMKQEALPGYKAILYLKKEAEELF